MEFQLLIHCPCQKEKQDYNKGKEITGISAIYFCIHDDFYR